ncbi:copper chaperone PCu(A)C [Paraburkholderia bonniea]|uniref:copper chaperone PCu(A)C n=1 Tax=Paraburkholderia bonniea TaxID=2152891 RepID=UPI0012916C28|nr:copper chaperone PCu(A)C [Paraburkholderia bonniea]WJF92025.1 copper chaperone PCu(A)C [Paraburkholderia bonniea]WJF95345.1 copper chaperone PCu(A)C [Paraburkholderia bonniea]
MKATLIQLGAALAVASVALNAQAADVRVDQCWIRAMPGTTPSAAYFELHNDSAATRTLTGVKTAAFGMVMMHQTQTNGSTSTMVHVASVPVPANGAVSFAPKGYHVMLERPAEPLKVGSTLPLTMTFDDNSSVSVSCAVKSPATMGQAAH